MNAKSHNLIWEPGGRNTHGNWRDWEDNGGETERMEHGKQLTETKLRKQRKEGRGGRERGTRRAVENMKVQTGETRNNKETATQKHEIQITSENKRELKLNTE